MIKRKAQLTVTKFLYLCNKVPRTIVTWLSLFVVMAGITVAMVLLAGLPVWLAAGAIVLCFAWHLIVMYRVTKLPKSTPNSNEK